MKVFQSIQDFSSTKKTVVTLGTFDGVHLGHKKIIERLIQNAIDLECESLLLTFSLHPRMVLQNDSDIKLLNTIDEKTLLLEQSGLHNLVIHQFDQAFSRLTAEEFVKYILVDVFNIKKIIIGHDHRFGRNRTANFDDLVFFGQKYNFEVEQITAQEINTVSISSTKIRSALLSGNIPLANQYLGYNYFLTGVVVKGKQLGRTINFSTANIEILQNHKLIPQNGVYIVQSIINKKSVYGMTNIGFNPTVAGNDLKIETHYFDFDEDIYSQKIKISFLQRIRSEQKFDSLELLKTQLENDKKTALSFIKDLN